MKLRSAPSGSGVRLRPLDLPAVDRIGTIQHDHLDAARRRLLQQVSKRRHVRVEAAADVLQVHDHRVDALQHLRCGAPGLAVQRVDRQAGLLVDRRWDLFVENAPDAVLGTEQRHQRQVLRRVERVDRRLAAARPAGVVGEQADLPAREAREALGLQHVDAGHRADRRPRARQRRPTAAPARSRACRQAAPVRCGSLRRRHWPRARAARSRRPCRPGGRDWRGRR